MEFKIPVSQSHEPRFRGSVATGHWWLPGRAAQDTAIMAESSPGQSCCRELGPQGRDLGSAVPLLKSCAKSLTPLSLQIGNSHLGVSGSQGIPPSHFLVVCPASPHSPPAVALSFYSTSPFFFLTPPFCGSQAGCSSQHWGHCCETSSLFKAGG